MKKKTSLEYNFTFSSTNFMNDEYGKRKQHFRVGTTPY